MLPFSNEALTLFRRTRRMQGGRAVETFVPETIRGCSWQAHTERVRDGGLDRANRKITCRIPSVTPPPRAGDFVLRGAADGSQALSADEPARMLAQGADAFLIRNVTERDQVPGPLAHIKIEG